MMHSTAVMRLGRRKTGLSLLIAAIAAIGVAGPASATTYNPDNGTQLQDAVTSANSNPGLDVIQLKANLYQPTKPMTITDDLVIKGLPAQQAPPGTKIDGSFVNPLQSDLFTIAAGKKLTFKAALLTNAADLGFAAFRDNGSLELDNATISGNNGVQVAVAFGASMVANNSTIDDGNDIGMTVSGTATLNNVTLANNNLGVDSSTGTLTVRNTIIAKNVGPGGTQPDCLTPVTSSIASMDSDATCGVQRTADAKLGPVITQGGPTSTMALGAGSPAIDTGDNSFCPTVDGRYFVRTDGKCDLGAFEVGAVRDTTAPSCTVSAVRAGPPKQQDVTAQDTASGLDGDAISNVAITNGSVAFTPFTSASTAGLVLTATKTDQTQLTRWSFTATDVAGNVKDCR